MALFFTLWVILFVGLATTAINSNDRQIKDEPLAFGFFMGVALSAFFSFILNIIAIFSFYMLDIELREDEWFKTKTELYSLQDFSNTSSTGFYMISTNSDYISFVKKDGGFVKYSTPSSSVIVQDETLVDIGYHEQYKCKVGEERGSWLFNIIDKSNCGWGGKKVNYSRLIVPEGTIIKNFRVGS